MKRILIFVFILGSSLVSADGQVAGSTPVPAVATQRVIPPRRDEGIYEARRKSNSQIDRTEGALIASRSPAFRKPTNEDLMLVAPDSEETAKYADFLSQSKTGLIRLLSDAGCQENANLVVAKDFCIKYKNVFGGSSYSFRTRNYTFGRFSDVVYKDGWLYTIGKMTLGFMADLGKDVSLKDVSAQTAGAKYVFEFLPPEGLPQIESAVMSFQKGVEKDGFRYQRSYFLQEDHTYILRSVAYRKREQRERNKLIYDDLTNDNRKDVIIAFRVVKLPDAEKDSVTLLWKELQRKETAKIAVEEK